MNVECPCTSENKEQLKTDLFVEKTLLALELEPLEEMGKLGCGKSCPLVS
jgi:hypothetical protein